MVGYIGFDPGANSSVTRVTTTTSPTSPINHSDLDGSTSIYLPFDSDVNDDSSHGHTGQAFGDATISSTQSKWGGNSLYLDGSDVVRYSTDDAMKLSTEDFTIEAWVYRTSNVSYGTVVARWDSAGNNRSYIARFDGHTPYFYYTTNGSSGSTVGRSFAGVTTSLNTWHHVAWVRKDGYLKFYLDGVESSSVYNMSGVNIFGASDSKFAVGGINSTPSGHLSGTNFFAGYIDDLRIIKGKGLYSGAFTPPAAAVGVYNSYPVSLYLPFDSDIQDDSTHAHTVTASGDAAVSSAQSKFGGNSLALDGTGDYLSVSADTDFRTDDEFTLEGWARASSLSGFNTIIEQKSTDTTETFTLGIENNYLKATQVTTALSDWLFDTSFTGNNQQYSSDKRSITGSSGGLASAMNDTFINISVGETAYYVVEFTVQNLRNSNSFAVGWSANPSGFTRNGQTFNNPPPWGEHGSGTTIQIGLRPRPFLTSGYASRTFALGIKLTRNTSTTGSGEAYFFVDGVDQTDSTTKTLSSAVANSFATNGFRFGSMVWDNNEWSIGPAGATSGYLSSYTTAMGGTPSLGVVTTASSTSITQTSGKTISTDEWFHYALGFNDGDVEIFHDGVKVSSGSSPTSSSAKAITIGASSSGENTFAGYLDDIRFSRVTRYTKNFVPPSAAVGATLNGTNETNTTTGFTSLYLPFDSDVNDDSDDPFTITASGGAAISSTQAKFGGNSLGLDGTNDYLTVSSSQSAMAFAGDFTIEYWMYPTGLDGDYQGPMACHNSSGWLFQFASGGGRFFINSGNIISTTAATSSNQWYHVAVTRRSGIVRLFIDGVQQGSLTFTSAMPTNNDLIIGASNASGQNFAGYLDDIRIMDGYAKYTTEFSPPSSAVGTSISETHNDLTILYMPFDDYLNDTARDHSVDKIGNVNVNTSVKKFGTGSAYFDGSNDALIVGAGSPDDFNLKNHDFTIELWAYLTSTATARLIHYGTGESYAPILFQSHSGSFRFYASKGGTWSPVNNALLGTVSLNTWTHLAATREGNTFRCFQDGVLKSTTVADYGVELMDATGSGITIGRYPTGIQSVPGYLDDIRIIKGKAIYTEAFTPPTQALGPQVQGGGVVTTTRTVDKKELGSVWTLNRGSGQARGKSFINLRKRGRWRKSKLKTNEGHRYREGTTESKVAYYMFTSPGEIPTGGFTNITRVDYLGVTAGGSGTTGGNRNWSPGSSGDSGTITAHLNQPGSPSSPISVTVGSAFPQTIDGPESAPDSPLTIPSAVQTAFNHYNITGGAAGAQGAGAKGGGPGGLGTPGPANGPGGAGGVSFAVLTSAHPDWTTHDNLTTPEIPAVTASLGSPGSAAPHPGSGSYNSGGKGGGGGVGYGAGGGAGAGGAPPGPASPGPQGGNGGGGAGGAGSPAITLVRIQGTVFTASGGDGFSTSGGTQIESGGYKYHVFTSPGTFTMSGGTKDLEYLVVAGGGGGGGSSASDTGAGGGGGAGGLRQGTLPAVSVGSYAVTVGTGGAGTNGQGTAGNNSVFEGGGAFSTITAYGGGAGGSGSPQVAGGAGGSGGGGGGDHGPQPGGTATPGDGGNPGGTSAGPTGDNAGGGGGAGAAGENALGQNPTANRKGGGGGAGAPYPAYAAPIIAPAIPSAAESAIGPTGLYAGGGGGSTNQSPPAGYGGGPGGPGGGGRGNSPLNTQYGRGEDGVDGTGGGGGGANHQTSPRVGGDGGDGIVIIRYSTS
tara:strand:+ start:119 stop:5299 length:5181 start_codon:yes stop_codon:yes gene_type:complete